MARASKDLSVEITGSKQEIAVVRLTRGAKRNALSDGLIAALREQCKSEELFRIRRGNLDELADWFEGAKASGPGELAAQLDTVPEVLDYQGYAGTAAPINFNGLVRQYYLRQGANVGDLQVNLVDRRERERKSHEIALALRPRLAEIGRRHGAPVQVVEVPPGPPVLSPIVAEVSGPD